MTGNESRTVWSSDVGDLRKQTPGQRKVKSLAPQEQTVYLHRDSKGRGGKTVTLIKKLILSEEEMKDLAKTLKQICGSGGTVKEDVIEIQGERHQKITDALKRMGYKVKIVRKVSLFLFCSLYFFLPH